MGAKTTGGVCHGNEVAFPFAFIGLTKEQKKKKHGQYDKENKRHSNIHPVLPSFITFVLDLHCIKFENSLSTKAISTQSNTSLVSFKSAYPSNVSTPIIAFGLQFRNFSIICF